jgi:hypothetical protein
MIPSTVLSVWPLNLARRSVKDSLGWTSFRNALIIVTVRSSRSLSQSLPTNRVDAPSEHGLRSNGRHGYRGFTATGHYARLRSKSFTLKLTASTNDFLQLSLESRLARRRFSVRIQKSHLVHPTMPFNWSEGVLAADEMHSLQAVKYQSAFSK